jgi:hypothetical protein
MQCWEDTMVKKIKERLVCFGVSGNEKDQKQ